MKASQLLEQAKLELVSVSNQAYQESVWLLSHLLDTQTVDTLSQNSSANHSNSLDKPSGGKNHPTDIQISLSDIYLDKVDISVQVEKQFWEQIQKRKKQYPLDYLLGQKYFLNHSFYIEEGVFIPRPETESLVKPILKQYSKDKKIKFMDWGAGVGTICLSILSYFFKSECTAVEIHSKSIKCLKKNSQLFNVQDRLSILKTEVLKINLQDLNQHLKAIDLITANPPYIDPTDKSIHPEVYLYEPPLALFSSQNGMAHIKTWFYKAMDCLSSQGIYVFEFGWEQSQLVKEFLNRENHRISYKILKDSLGYDRVAWILKK